MTNNQNLTQAQVAEIEALTSEQLKAVRLNIQSREHNDEQTREAVAEYVVDGGSVADLLATPGQATYRIEQMDRMGNWSEDFAWNQGGNEFDSAEEAEAGIDFILTQYGDINRDQLRVVEAR